MIIRSNNSKVKFSSTHKNTFGLLHGSPSTGGTCVGATCGTGGCLDVRDGLKRQTCYVEKITQIYKNVGNVLSKNTAALSGRTQDEIIVVLTEMMEDFVKRTPSDKLFFRLHWAGDFFSEEYASAWACVMHKFDNVQFWCYTRSFKNINFIKPFIGVTNLTLFLSCDPVNYDLAQSVYNELEEQMPNLALAYIGEELPNDRRWVVCPETSKKIKSDKDKGACAKCRLCVNNYVTRPKNIAFKIH